ncbi:hypothetical protein COOONC_08668 [Cooperia oncophora]
MYDYGSLMHYGTTRILCFMLNKHYNCIDVCKGWGTKCENEGFPKRPCSECICPSGYGGKLCGKKPDDCGREVEATDTWSKLVDSVGENTTFTAREDFKKCHYWIKGIGFLRNGLSLKSNKLAYFPGSLAVDGCKYAGVEIKTDPDKRRTGYRFCSKDDINTTLNSTLNIVPVITYNRLYFTETELLYRAKNTSIEHLELDLRFSRKRCADKNGARMYKVGV